MSASASIAKGVQPERDLSFRPVSNDNPQCLSAAQIALFNREGYVSPLDVFSREQALANRSYFNSLLDELGEGGAYAINCFQARCQGIWDICTEPRILDLVEDILGPNIVCWASHFFCKLPGDTKQVPWHQDASYWWLSPARTVTVWLAIDDADEENSAMRFIPGTHRAGPLKVKESQGDSVLHLETSNADALGQPFSNNLHAGQVSLHSDMLVHGSLPNRSARRRCGLTLRYCAPEVEILDASWKQGVEAILCRGEDKSLKWEHHARPQGNDLSSSVRPKSLGGN